MYPRNPTIDLIIVDDDEELRSALAEYFLGTPDISVVGSFGSGSEALNFLTSVTVDVILCDVRMPGMSGVEFTAAVNHQGPGIRVLGTSTFEDRRSMVGMLEAGAHGFILKSADPASIADAVRATDRGTSFIAMHSPDTLLRHMTDIPPVVDKELTRHQTEVLGLLCRGRSNAEIAQVLDNSESAVKKSVSVLMSKFGVNSRLQLVVAALGTSRP